ncbi:MAG: nif-specific transcriptional activator NifA [Azoarcus sp.]|jgi:Nif-specific regulatory protein|nr:nif-specific transcriptional activator NifA [Azoarcus sp.]
MNEEFPGKDPIPIISTGCPVTHCGNHDLRLNQLAALYSISQVLSCSLDYHENIREVLGILDERVGLGRGLISVVEPNGGLLVQLVHGLPSGGPGAVRYQAGEGIIGFVLENDCSVVLARVGDDARFTNKTGIYDPALPVIAVPVKASGALKGVLAVQAQPADETRLQEHAHFLEMIANLISQSLRFSLQIEQEKHIMREERDRLRRTVRLQHGFDSIVGRSAVMRRIFEQMRLVAKWNTTVLIRGETGTGKELIANAIHYNSPRARGPLVKLNCAALPESLLESELFGHERGSFTGAIGSRKGRFEQADGGTLFLDEIGEISPTFQAKLLRVLQEGEFERVGGSASIKVDVRIIAATHCDLEAAIDKGDFREDLFYRLNVMPLYLPPLRDRPEDIPGISRHLLAKIGEEQKRKLTINDQAIHRLAQYNWPGNVRELENCLERAAVLSEDGLIDSGLIRIPALERLWARNAAPAERKDTDTSPGESPSPEAESERQRMEDERQRTESERQRLIAALEQTGWVQARAARLLNMTPRQISYRIRTLRIDMKQF